MLTVGPAGPLKVAGPLGICPPPAPPPPSRRACVSGIALRIRLFLLNLTLFVISLTDLNDCFFLFLLFVNSLIA